MVRAEAARTLQFQAERGRYCGRFRADTRLLGAGQPGLHRQPAGETDPRADPSESAYRTLQAGKRAVCGEVSNTLE